MSPNQPTASGVTAGMASDDRWYVRSRGRTQGPFTREQLIAMRDLGTLARFHQLSRDQAGWIAAGTLPELFPAATSPAPPQGHSVPRPGREPSYELEPEPEPTPELSGLLNEPWFYSRDGAPVGPVPFAELRSLAIRGALPPGTLVWNEKMPDWVEAATVDALRIGPESRSSGPRPGPGPIDFGPSTAAPGSTSGPAIAGFVSGLASILALPGFFIGTLALVGAKVGPARVGMVALSVLIVGGLTGLFGVVFSAIGLSRINRAGGALRGRGPAIAGLVTAILGLAGAALLTILVLIGAAAASRS